MKQKTLIQKFSRAITVEVEDDFPDSLLEEMLNQVPNTIEVNHSSVNLIDEEHLALEIEVVTEAVIDDENNNP